MWTDTQQAGLARISESDIEAAVQVARRYLDRRYRDMLETRPGDRRRWEYDALAGLGLFLLAGRRVRPEVVERQLLRVVKGLEQEAAAASESRETKAGAWALVMLGIVKSAALVAAAFAHGGWGNVDGDVVEAVEEQVRSEVKYLDKFADEVQSGKTRRDGRFVRRAMLYAGAAWALYRTLRGRIAKVRGFTEEQNVLDPGAEHCDECVDESARGWVPLGSLSSIGSRACRNNDRCRIIYRKGGETAA